MFRQWILCIHENNHHRAVRALFFYVQIGIL